MLACVFSMYYVSAEIQKTVLLLLIVHAEMHKTHPKNNRPRHWKPNAWPIDFGRDEATRTPDPYVPNVVRYQLRYIPINLCFVDAKVVVFYELTNFFGEKFGDVEEYVYLCNRK